MSSLSNERRLRLQKPNASDRSDKEIAQSVRPPRVSVIIPAYNSAAKVKGAIKSALAQTYKDFEIVVIDDGSTDETESVVRSFGDRVLYFKQENQGAGAARNAGIKRSSGEFIAFLDSDDLWSPEKLDEQIPLLERDPELGLVYSDWAVVSEDKVVEESYLKTVPSASGYVFDQLVRWGFILTSGVVVRRACLNDVGDFDNSLSIAQDYDLWLRICYRWKVALVNKPLVTKRSWDGSLSSNLAKTAVERIALYKKTLGTLTDMPQHSRRLIERQLALNYWDVGYHYFDQFLFQEARKQFLSSLRHNWMNAKTLGYLVASCLPRRLAKAVRGIKWAIS
jgi:glycosyltransferase involved in cell wall biosynthesis